MKGSLGQPALIVVDVQNDFVHPEGKAGRGGSDVTPLLGAVAVINRLVGAARAASVPVVYVRVTHSPAVDNPAYRARYVARGMAVDDLLCADGSWGAELYSELVPPTADELVITKHAYDGFSVPDLAAHLQRLNIDTVIVTGVVTELCVMGTAAGAFEHGFHVIVPSEAAGSVNAAASDAALDLVSRFYGRVATAADIEAELVAQG
ncbi:MAG: isochorismatase family cysteine hydrolase [Candidatus Limnocylindrales bacterium]